MRFAGEYGKPTATDRNNRLFWLAGCVATARTANAAGRSVLQELGAPVGRKITERTERLEMVGTPDKRDCESVEKQKRDGVSSGRLERSLTRTAVE